MQLGIIGMPAPMEWKKHDTDYNYAWGEWNSAHRALDLMFKLFWLLHIVTIAALGAEWLEGVKILGVNFFLCIAICFFYLGGYHMTGGKPYIPGVLMLGAAAGIGYTLKSVQSLI